MLSKKFLVCGTVSLAIAVQSNAMESNVKDALEIQKGEFFAIDGIDLAKKYQDHFDTLNLKQVDENYRLAADHHKIDLDIYRGEKFEPRSFWKLSPREIIGILAPALEECKVWDMVKYRYQRIGICCANDFPDGPYPEDMERILKKSVFDLIKKYLISKEILKPSLEKLFLECTYRSSLMYYRNKDQEIDDTDKLMVKYRVKPLPNMRNLPLIQYFEPYFIPQNCEWHSCDKK